MEKIAQSKKTLNLGSGTKKDQILLLSNLDIEGLVKDLKIKHFRGVFVKDELPKKINEVECVIINLEKSYQEGSHWTAYHKNKEKKYYFDSNGDAPPPKN